MQLSVILPLQHCSIYHCVSFSKHITSAKFQLHQPNISRDIVDSVISIFGDPPSAKFQLHQPNISRDIVDSVISIFGDPLMTSSLS